MEDQEDVKSHGQDYIEDAIHLWGAIAIVFQLSEGVRGTNSIKTGLQFICNRELQNANLRCLLKLASIYCYLMSLIFQQSSLCLVPIENEFNNNINPLINKITN